MPCYSFDKSYLRKLSIKEHVPITELILKTFYHKLGQPITLLGISPISPIVVEAALLAAKEAKAPIMFIASLNQVDIDGGYTGWTPESFVRFLGEKVEKLRAESPVIVGLDHGGPWLKDRHVLERYDLETAMEMAKKSIESAIKAGYDVIHIDTTVDLYNPKLEADIVAKRTLELLEFSEEIRNTVGRSLINYEIGSDRWIYKDIEHVKNLIQIVKRGIKERKLDDARILFVVGDVGTKVAPGNRLDPFKAKALVELASVYGFFLKTHSTDYVENPEEFPRIGIGGANIGPMYADIMYKVVKDLSRKEEEFVRQGLLSESSRVIHVIYEEIVKDGRWRKYVKGDNPNVLLRNDFLMGICSRYVWCNPRVNLALEKLFKNLEEAGLDGKAAVIGEIKNNIRHYMRSFNLENLLLRIGIKEQKIVD